MRPRMASVNARGRVRKRTGSRMFRRLRAMKSWRLTAADADGVEITPSAALIDRVAAVHRFGETDRVGHLLGFSEDDHNTALEIASDLLAPAAR